jgi:hypothetical protein
MKITFSKVIYNVIVNIPVCFCLAIAGALMGGSTINWANLGINFSISFVLAMLIGLFVPLTAIGRWFTALFRVPNETYTHNLRYRLLATFISSCIFYFIISPILTVANFYLVPNQNFGACVINWLVDIPFLLLVGFLSTLASDLVGYKAAHKIDQTF